MNVSIELCRLSGLDAATELYRKICDPKRALIVGGFVVAEVTKVGHTDDGLAVVTVCNSTYEPMIFQFDPISSGPFPETAVNQDGNRICLECS
jgi:hypothetical protein